MTHGQTPTAPPAPPAPPPSRHVTLHAWRVPTAGVPQALWRIAHDRRPLRATPGVRFAKLLGTARDRAFGPTRADLTRWAALVVWDDATAATTFDQTRVARAWRALATAYCRIDCQPLHCRGRWAGREPFGPEPSPAPSPPEGPVLALTRARLRLTRGSAFWRAINPVAVAVAEAPGLIATFGIGEAPVGWQGTVSLWQRPRDLVEFVRRPQHRRVVDQTPTMRWYAEELFARFAVLTVSGDRDVIGWAEERPVSR
jgi:hypothetical protein